MEVTLVLAALVIILSLLLWKARREVNRAERWAISMAGRAAEHLKAEKARLAEGHKLETLMGEYLATLDDERAFEGFATARQHAEVDLNRFLSWTRIQGGEQE